MHRTLTLALAFHWLSAPARAQDEAALRTYFEGRTVTLRIAMPAAEAGIDVYPGTSQPIDFPELAKRMKKYGVAIQAGQPALITKLKVKGKLIEFQLDGGGYGTMGDQTDPTVSVGSTPKSQREKDLEKAVKTETDPTAKRRLQDELNGVRSEREREDRRNAALAAGATERNREYIQSRRLQGGSRFNLRYNDGVPAEALTPDAVQTALHEYVDFGTPVAGQAAVEPVPDTTPPPPTGPLTLQKGMGTDEVDQLLGTPTRRSSRKEGTLTVNVRTYDTKSGRVVAEFVEDVLFRYTITSR